jgi:hypothetical protein
MIIVSSPNVPPAHIYHNGFANGRVFLINLNKPYKDTLVILNAQINPSRKTGTGALKGGVVGLYLLVVMGRGCARLVLHRSHSLRCRSREVAASPGLLLYLVQNCRI